MPDPVSSPLVTRVRRIQAALGVRPDGVLGPETLSALETRLQIKATPAATSLECSMSSLEQIVQFEVTSRAAYEQKYQRPIWPGGESGVTIGIGYDLGVTGRKQIQADWSGEIPDSDLAALLVVQGVTGPNAKKLAQGLAKVSIPYSVAETVFFQSTLPRYASRTRTTYPGIEELPADAQGMMLSLIYNRGTRLTGPSRTEMAAIKPLVPKGITQLDAIADQFESMVRLWPTVPGLQKRRKREAQIIRNSQRAYTPEELIRL